MEIHLITIISTLGGLIIGLLLGLVLAKKVNRDTEKLAESLVKIDELNEKLASEIKDKQLQNDELTKSKTMLTLLEKECDELKNGLLGANEELIKLRDLKTSFSVEKEALNQRVLEQKNEITLMQDKFKEELKRVNEKMSDNFQVLAQKIFDEKTEKFKVDSKESLENLLAPLKNNIDVFKKEISDKYLKENESRIRLEQEIKNLTNLSQTLSKEANNLSSALSGSVKSQGNWGEIVLERVLKYSGLKEGVDFIREGKGLGLKNIENKIQKPDVVINLPDEKHLIIDSKVTLNSYTRYIDSEDDESKNFHLGEFIIAFKNRISELSGKNYELNEKLFTPEYVLMFTPIEGALSLAMEKDPTLFEFGWDKRVILVGPTNLLATLKAVESVWKQDKQEKNALRIAEQGGKLYDKFVGFITDMEDIKKGLNKTNDSYEKAFKKLSVERGNLVGQVEKMKKLGAKAKKSLPSNLLEEVGEISHEQSEIEL